MLSHGGIAMSGGRDWDRALIDNVIKPWLFDNFNLPENLTTNPEYKSLMRLAAWAAERAKIQLSAQDKDNAIISLSEAESRIKDMAGNDIYMDIPLDRETLNNLIADRINESIEAARETLTKAGLTANDVEDLIFVGGPTNYKPLRDKVAFELSLKGSLEVNPMTAVSEGAALFAESIDWNSQNRGRKSTRGKISSAGASDIGFNYHARTPNTQTTIVAQVSEGNFDNAEFQIDSVDTGWTSGRLPLATGITVDVTLGKSGDNVFMVFAFDATGAPLSLESNKIVITRTAATIDAIPASHSIGIEVLGKLGGSLELEWIIREGDQLPQKGSRVFKSTESIKAGSSNVINFKIWEGEIENPVTDNRFIGVFKISGTDFDSGVIPAGADLNCNYEVLDSGNIVLEVSVPSIGGAFEAGHNFYSRQEGQIDYSNSAALIVDSAESTMSRLDTVREIIDDPKLNRARQQLLEASNLDPNDLDTEQTKEAADKIQDARRLLAQVRKEHLKEIRQLDLNSARQFFDDHAREHARPSEETVFDNLVRTAQREIDRNGTQFENHHQELRGKTFGILARQDWFVVAQFKIMAQSPYNFFDQHKFKELVETGMQFIQTDNIDKLRGIIGEMIDIKISTSSETDLLDITNIVRG